MASVQPPNPLPPDQNVGPILLGISGTCLALVIITTSVRIWVRTALRSSGWDDYTIVIVTLLGVARFGVQVGQPSIEDKGLSLGFDELRASSYRFWNRSCSITRRGDIRSKLLGVYAITAIWSNLELYLGIVGANLALSRSIFAHFFREGGTTKGSSYAGMPRSTSASRNLRVPNSSGFRSGQSYLQSRDQDSEISLMLCLQLSRWLPRRRRHPDRGLEDVDAAVDAAEKAFHAWKKTRPEVHKALVLKLAYFIDKNAEAILMKIVHHRPLGVSVGIIPCDAPFPTAIYKTSAPIAAGNCYICKPSEKTPFVTLALGTLVKAAGFPPGVFQILTGDGSTGSHLMRVKKVSFTG
ncbi:aldehyde dehydrogenase X mitochondrial precursor [Fusarium mexicanum]|uniref:aldehyde dehydrogenase (NAD(+)) n=1 Tax=Fusarium mexicanum TaxID=751941 RepID=A0A8H5N4G9_9HYPO|nr:aldehyde dehydrogenase X mitochondrial precursor [Fusarium mexicanum]